MAVVLTMLSVELSQEGFPGAVITSRGSTLHPTGAQLRPKVAAAAASSSSGAGLGANEEKTLRLNNNKYMVIQ